ncbi:hypothetical protein SAMN05444285_1665 [Draconibacterium orientale]|uniref:Uncharacterized protein n=2 Tax=Draconibacterium orientale TaxID=1168034 RepID=A0A1I0JZH9_9BACT|nr:hypothetical protein SAMN05444285_1665 [Draconibacterium orientale]
MLTNILRMNNPTLHIYTHCQVAPAATQTETWQRVYLSYRTDGKINNEGTTKCINHWANSANFKVATLNQRCIGLTGKCFEMPNASYTNRYGAAFGGYR